MKFSKKEFIYIGSIVFLLLVVSVSFFFVFDNNTKEEMEDFHWLGQEVEQMQEEEESTSSIVIIDVKGAVYYPGVYELKEGARVKDVIVAAGGFLEQADERLINLAAKLEDEMVLYVPLIGEELNDNAIRFLVGSETDNGKIRVNHASSQELEQLTGIGPAKAAAIISYREENGPFKELDDLLAVPGIGVKSLEKIREQINLK